MKKFKVFTNFQEEETWLNEMAKKGHILKSYSNMGVYTFQNNDPSISNYRVDYKMFATKSDYISYLSLFKDAGWKHVWGTQNSGNQYFLAEEAQADADIFSDSESANKRYKSLFALCATSFCLWIAFFLLTLTTRNFDIASFGFLTPGLWDKMGAAFWKSFFFELPFVIFRVGFFIIFLVMGIVYGYWAIKTKREYDRIRKSQNQ